MRSLIRVALTVLTISLIPSFAAAQERYAEFAGVKIHYIDRGLGAPVVLLHGGTSDLRSWTRWGVVEKLGKDFRVIAMDTRGDGKSSKPRDPAAYGRQVSLDVIRLLDELKIERAHIVGYSMGGNLVAQLLTLHPERFRTATQVAGAGRPPSLANDPRLEQEAAEIEKDCISRSRMIRQAGSLTLTEEQIHQRIASCLADKDFDRYSVAASIRGYPDQIVTPQQMRAVRVPTLGVVGSLDPVLKDMQALKELRPDMDLVVVDGVSHSGPTGIQAWSGLAATVKGFIGRHTQ
jgi:pimeloyl-ACP methyl ester carboxylesterase